MLAIIAGVFFAADDQTVVVTIIPSMMTDLNVGVTELNKVSWTITGYLLGYVAVMPVMGRLSDIFGRRNIYVIGMVIFMLGSIGTAMTGSMYWLIDSETLRNSNFGNSLGLIVRTTSTIEWIVVTRIIQSIGAGALVPVSIAMVADIYPIGKRAMAFGLIGAAAEMGAVIGPVWGGLLTKLLDWQWVFWLNIPIAIVVLSGIYLSFPNTKKNKGKVDYIGAAMIAGALCLITLGFSYLGQSNTQVYFYLTLGVLCLIGYPFRAARISNPIIPLALFRNLEFVASNIVNILYGAALMIALVTIPLMANTILMKSPMEGALILSRLTIAIPIGAIIGGVLTKKLDRRIPSITALVMCGMALLLMKYWDQNIEDPLMSLHLIIAGLGFGLIIAPVTVTAVNSGRETMKGAAAGVITTSRFIGMTLGVSAIAAWGSGQFQDLLIGVEVPLQSVGETATQMSTRLDQFQTTLTGIGVSIFSDFYQVAGIICILAIFPCIFMKKESSSY